MSRTLNAYEYHTNGKNSSHIVYHVHAEDAYVYYMEFATHTRERCSSSIFNTSERNTFSLCRRNRMVSVHYRLCGAVCTVGYRHNRLILTEFRIKITLAVG